MSDAPTVDFAIHEGAFAEDPYPTIAALRAHTPVCWHEPLQAFLVTRYVDVRTVISDAGRFLPALPVEPDPARRNMILMNGDEHRRYRRVLQPPFARSALSASIEPLLEPLAHRLIDAFIDVGNVDLVSAFANPLPASVILSLLAPGDIDMDQFTSDADTYLEFVADPQDARLAELIQTAGPRLEQTITSTVQARRQDAAPGLITDLLAADLSDAEVFEFVALLLIAGIETTQRLIANTVLQLCRLPQAMTAARGGGDALARIIEETLRFLPSNHFRIRYAVGDQQLQGVTVPAGSKVLALTAGANRDPAIFAHPDEFDFDRPLDEIRQHVGFGWGPHACIGAALARLETQTAIGALLDRTVDFCLQPSAAIRFAGFRNRSAQSIPIEFTRRST